MCWRILRLLSTQIRRWRCLWDDVRSRLLGLESLDKHASTAIEYVLDSPDFEWEEESVLGGYYWPSCQGSWETRKGLVLARISISWLPMLRHTRSRRRFDECDWDKDGFSTALRFSSVNMIVSIDYAARVLYNRLSIVLIGSDPPRHGVSVISATRRKRCHQWRCLALWKLPGLDTSTT